MLPYHYFLIFSAGAESRRRSATSAVQHLSVFSFLPSVGSPVFSLVIFDCDGVLFDSAAPMSPTTTPCSSGSAGRR